jgi:hypothetical protein
MVYQTGVCHLNFGGDVVGRHEGKLEQGVDISAPKCLLSPETLLDEQKLSMSTSMQPDVDHSTAP